MSGPPISRELYSAYLQSREWATRRDKVIWRARGICEGCGTRPATEVHHLTYAHVTQEFLFELVAVCGDCHARVHDAPARPMPTNWTPRRSQSVFSVSEQKMQRQLGDLAAEARAKFMATQPQPPPPMNERLAALARKFHKVDETEDERPISKRGDAA